MQVRIYSPARSAMQSGKKNTKEWLLLPLEEKNSRFINPLMGWVSSNDTMASQVKLSFPSKEEAIKYAISNNWEYVVQEPKTPTIKKKSYASNFT
jgi:hypothetical protein